MDEKNSSSVGVFSIRKTDLSKQMMIYGRYLWWMFVQPERLQTHLNSMDTDQTKQMMALSNWCMGIIIWCPLLILTGIIGFSQFTPFAPEGLLVLLMAFGAAIWLTGQDETIANALSSNAVVQVGTMGILASMLLVFLYVEQQTADLMVIGLALFNLLLSMMAVAILAALSFSILKKPVPLILFACLGACVSLLLDTATLPLLFLTLIFNAAVLTTYLSQEHQHALQPVEQRF